VHELFEAQAAARPDAEAVRDAGGRRLTYGALNAQANQLARRLVAHGVDRGTRVGLYLDRSLELVVAILGVLKAGGAYVPLETTQPADRLAFMVRDAALPLVLTRAALQPACALLLHQAHDERPDLPDVEVLSVEALQTEAAGEAETNLGLPITGDDLAYVIYTSGSTGQPKGTEVPHRAIPGFAVDVDALRYDAGQTLLHYSSISWDVLTLELWPALLTGGRTVVIADRLVRASDLRRAIETQGITTLWLTSSFFNAVVDEDLETLATLQQLLIGGEALSPSHVRRVVERYPALHLVNGYGPSECTVFTTCQVITPAVIADGGAVPIGQPIGDRRVRVLDRERRLVPPGVVGELYVGGPAVPRGYGQRPALTAERLVPDPYGAAGARLYRTGDLVRWRCDGTLDFIGRVDDQVKVRGFRIELAEVELALRACPGVRDAVVVANPDPTAPGQRLVGYVVLAAGGGLRAIATDLGTRLPGYMVPTAWVALDAVPLTPNGKVDKRALPAPARGPRSPDEPAAPRDAVETTIAAIVSEVLGLAAVGLDDDFFALGGHSLSAARVLARIRSTVGADLTLRALFEAPTVAGLARRATAALGQAVDRTPLVAVDRTQPQPLSLAQERLWFVHQIAPAAPVYNVFRAFALRGPLSQDALDASWRGLVQRHESLRTRFPRVDGKPVQVIEPEPNAPLAVIDLTRMPASRRDAEAQLLADAESRRPFDLASGPVARATLIRLGPNDHHVLLALHHIVCDGWSMDVLQRDWAAIYAAECDGRDADLPPLQLQPVDFASWQRERLREPATAGHVRYWTERLAGAPPVLTLPWDRPRPAVQTFDGRHLWRKLPPALSDQLRNSARGAGVTLFVYLLAAYKALLLRYTGQRSPVVGTPVTDRGHVLSERLVGFFVDTAALRTDLAGDPAFATLLERVRDTVLEAHDHAVPFETVIAAVQPARDLSASPLFQTMFVLQNLAARPQRFAELEIEPRSVEATTSKFDLTVVVDATSDELRLLFEYNESLFDVVTIERFAAHYVALISNAVQSPGMHLSELGLGDAGTADDPHQVEASQYDVKSASFDAPAHCAFESLARRQPDALAVVFDAERVTYREVNERANRLAHHLRALGVGAETTVGVFVDRSVDLIVSFWAVLKSGGVYLPLDPAYPRERLEFLLADSGAQIVVTHRGFGRSIPASGVRVVDVDAERAALAQLAADNLEGASHPESLAYSIYTSGSTGRPKGAQLTHAGLSNLARAQAMAFALAAGDRVLQFSSPSFDASIFEIVLGLLAGGAIVLARRERLVPGRELVELLREHAVTTVVMPPSVLSAVPERDELPALQTIIAAGEACPADLVARWARGRRFFNAYGPTETTVWATVAACAPDGTAPSIGAAIANVRTCVLDDDLSPAPVGVAGELCIGGIALARGYSGRPGVTADRFVPDPAGGQTGARLYRTGDRVRRRADGQLEFLGRLDQQVKVRGFRIELHEIEAALREHAGVRDAAVAVRGQSAGDRRLVGYVVPKSSPPSVADLGAFLRRTLPEHMVPAVFATIDSLPLTPHGKLDRDALPEPEAAPVVDRVAAPPTRGLERTIADAWCRVLGVPSVGVDDSFFALGGHSLLLAQLQQHLHEALGRPLSIVELFQYPTVRALAAHLDRGERSAERHAKAFAETSVPPSDDVADGRAKAECSAKALAERPSLSDAVAVVGLACRVPGAGDVDTFWRNLCNGVESIRFFSDADVEDAGVEARVRANAAYVKAGGVLDGVDRFDAAFFGFTPRDAERTDPQHRLLIECAWEALEHAGCAGSRRERRVGVFAGAGTSGYFDAAPGASDRIFGSAADFLATRVSHRLDLRGPSLTVQTACSTSLVAIHLACTSLLGGECDVALAGGVSIRLPQTRGYLHQEGGILSADGHCRAFDARATGTVGGNGAGVVVLKRYADAVAAGDTIYALVRGSAINNDGADKVGYTAPSVNAQAEVIAGALKRARVDAGSIGYVEAHGTGTPVGDPIEVAALTKAFAASTTRTGFCAIGTVKSNVGHLDAAAGVAGFIKAALAVHYGVIPPSLHFESPNPRIDFASSPFFVNAALRLWPQEGVRRAGVSSFGMGGTNVHVVLEQSPELPAVAPATGPQLLTLSAGTTAALDAVRRGLAARLRADESIDLGDVAWTLQTGRAGFEHRAVVWCADRKQALESLEGRAPERMREQRAATPSPAVVFAFPGQGAQHVQMARPLYDTEPAFRAVVDECCGVLNPELGFDLRDVLWPAPAQAEAATARVNQTAVAQPALFVVEYALARLWMSWGISPAALIGHSVGELVAACLAGVFSLADALCLVAARGALMQAVPGGAMLAVLRPETEVAGWLGADLTVAAVNAPERTVVSGACQAIDALESRLNAADVPCRRLRTSHAFHSVLMEPALAPFAACVAAVARLAPTIPIVSNLTGDWLTDAQAMSPEYWRRHLRETVRFADGVARAAAHGPTVFLEVGPAQTLRASLAAVANVGVVSSLPGPREHDAERMSMTAALGALWAAGVSIDWAAVHRGERRRRVALPTYPFERQSYWIDGRAATPKELPCDSPTSPANRSARADDSALRTDADVARRLQPSGRGGGAALSGSRDRGTAGVPGVLSGGDDLVLAVRAQLALMEQQLELLRTVE